MNKTPNILFLMADQLRPSLAGYAGNDVIRTPTMDWIAKEGVVFEHAYTPSPVCIPARQSMMSGQLPRTTGCELFGDDLPPFYRTFARSFSEQGYQTTCCGKLHHNGQDQMQGWMRRIGRDMVITERFVPNINEARVKEYKVSQDDHRWKLKKEILRAGVGHARNTVNDEYTLQGALDFIEDTFQSPYYDKPQVNQPLFLKVSFVLPHYPYYCQEDLFKYYLNRVPIYGKEQTLLGHPYLDFKHLEIGEDITQRDLQRATAAYYAMTETVDGFMGQVLDKLREAGQDLDEWMIVLTADHGEMQGEHGVFMKHVFYENSVRVPLVIRYPKKYEPRQIEENVNLCDLYRTLCELCDIPVPDGLDSRSLVKLMGEGDSNWSNESISQNKGYQLMIKQDEYKYQYYGEALPEVLFDLKENPEETINYIDHKEYKDLLVSMRKRRDELGFGPDGNANYINAGY